MAETLTTRPPHLSKIVFKSPPVDQAVGLDVGNDIARGPLVPVQLLGDEDPQLHALLLHQPVHPAGGGRR